MAMPIGWLRVIISNIEFYLKWPVFVRLYFVWMLVFDSMYYGYHPYQLVYYFCSGVAAPSLYRM